MCRCVRFSYCSISLTLASTSDVSFSQCYLAALASIKHAMAVQYAKQILKKSATFKFFSHKLATTKTVDAD